MQDQVLAGRMSSTVGALNISKCHLVLKEMAPGGLAVKLITATWNSIPAGGIMMSDMQQQKRLLLVERWEVMS